MMKRLLIAVIFLSLSSLLSSCGKALPPEWSELEGVWTNEEVYMEISSSGTFNYKRSSSGQKVEINTWIKEYSPTGFTVSTVVSTTDFVVNRKPYKEESSGVMRMVVDGRTLVKSEKW